MEFETLPTVPTAEELLDRSLRRAAAKKKQKRNRDLANEEFVRAVAKSIYDRLESVIEKFPDFNRLPPFYMDLVEILYKKDRIQKSLGAVQWAAEKSKELGYSYAKEMKDSPDSSLIRKRAVARISSVVNQVDSDLRFLNDARNVLRKLPDISDDFTVVVAGYPNVGKSSFIRLVSSATPEIANYPFTTKGIIVGHHEIGRERVQFVDTPGLLDRPVEERNIIEQQALSAIINTAHIILFILDPSEHCGYSVDVQNALLGEIRGMVDAPVVVAANKSDLMVFDGILSMSTVTGEGVDIVLEELLKYRSLHRQQESPQ